MPGPSIQLLPAQFGKYQLVEYLGGGMADVYRARDLVLGKIVAVKILKEENCDDDDVRARFLEEARTAAGFDNQSIINVFDFGEHDGRPFMVMEFLKGEDLGTAIQNGRTGDTAHKLQLALQVARGLEVIHARDIIHRDIKPANIHVNHAGVAKLIDFGIAKAPDATVKTQTGFAVGTLYYMAPEQVLGRATRLVDIYAFGLVLYELMCGKRAMEQDSMERTFYRILNEPVDLTPVKNCASPEIANLVRKCTEKAPEARIQSFTEICFELERLIAGPTSTKQLGAPTRAPAAAQSEAKTSSVWKLVGTALVLLVIAAGTVWFFFYRTAVSTASKASIAGKADAKPARTLNDRAGDMVLVSKGPFLFGAENTRIELPDFYIDRTEVTNRAYSLYRNAEKLSPPKANGALPVTNITVDDARAFCEWAGKRLPTAQEWEKAARGPLGNPYPWGNDPDSLRANVSDNPSLQKQGLMPADAIPSGASPYGALNMAGNAWEYVGERIQPSPKAIANFRPLVRRPCSLDDEWVRVRGGSYTRPISDALSREFIELPGCYRAPDIGFRCAK